LTYIEKKPSLNLHLYAFSSPINSENKQNCLSIEDLLLNAVKRQFNWSCAAASTADTLIKLKKLGSRFAETSGFGFDSRFITIN
jgi:hypothetical protein